jgi:hypothetical protein
MNESTRPVFYHQLIETRLLVESLREDDISTLAQHYLCRCVHHNVPCKLQFQQFLGIRVH